MGNLNDEQEDYNIPGYNNYNPNGKQWIPGVPAIQIKDNPIPDITLTSVSATVNNAGNSAGLSYNTTTGQWSATGSGGAGYIAGVSTGGSYNISTGKFSPSVTESLSSPPYSPVTLGVTHNLLNPTSNFGVNIGVNIPYTGVSLRMGAGFEQILDADSPQILFPQGPDYNYPVWDFGNETNDPFNSPNPADHSYDNSSGSSHDSGGSGGGGMGYGGPTGSYGGGGGDGSSPSGGGYENGASGGGGMGWGGPTGSYGDGSGSDGFPGSPTNHGPGPQWPGGQGSDPNPTPGNGAGGTGQIMDPILLDLSGHGIKITEESRSSVVMDATGSGLSHRTAWAGAGTAVLFFDPNDTGAITQKNQYVFTEWDPTAKDNMQALRDVFDSNGDGVLNASDAKFSQFKLMLTNADGTVTVETLAQAGIASISLKADTTNIQYSDGSAITGQTVFTYTNGTTGTVATANLSYDANGYKVIQTTAVSGSVTTITTTGTHADGSVAYNDVQATAISGNVNTRTLTYDDNVDANGSLRSDGVIDRSQMIVTTTNLDGSTTEAWTNYLGNQAVKQSAVQTTTSADGNTVTILRDDRGGGWFDQSENTLNVAANDNQRNLRWAA